MLGHRGVRLTVTYPEICAMQVRAILSAACIVQKEGKKVIPEIMIPLSLSKKELELMKVVVLRVAAEVFKEHGIEVKYKYGTMIELPRRPSSGTSWPRSPSSSLRHQRSHPDLHGHEP